MVQKDSAIDYTSYISERTTNFTGREWVFQAVNDWLADPDGSRFFLLTGEPGCGKTAIAARLAQFSQGTISPPDDLTHLTHNFLSVIHFCSARDSRWINPHVFAESLAMQLAARYPTYAKALAEKSGDRQIHIEVQQQIEQGQGIGVVINRLDVSGVAPEDAFNRVVREPLEALFHEGFNQQVVMLVDALDEALNYSGMFNIVSLLSHIDTLIPRVRFLLTSRQEVQIENEFLEADGLVISSAEFDQRNQEDIQQYVNSRLSDDKALAEKAKEVKPTEMVDLMEIITRKAEGNFLYVRFLLDAVARGQRLFIELEELPEGLHALYYNSLERVVKLRRRNWFKDYAPLMEVLSVARESLTIAQLRLLTGQPESVLWRCLSDLQQFIEMRTKKVQSEEERYQLYHLSFVDFLHLRWLTVGGKKRRNVYFLSPEEAHRRFIGHFRGEASSWNNVDWERVDDYGLLHLANHLYLLRDSEEHRQDLYRLMCKSFMKEKQTRYGLEPVARDLELMIEVASSREPPDLLQEVRGALIYSTLISLTTNVPLEILDALARAGQVTKAQGFISLIQREKDQVEAYYLLGITLLEQKQIEKARETLLMASSIAEKLPNDYEKVDRQLRLARTLIDADQNAEAVQMLKQTLNVIDAIKYTWWPKEADQIKVVQALAYAGQFDQALTMSETIAEALKKLYVTQEPPLSQPHQYQNGGFEPLSAALRLQEHEIRKAEYERLTANLLIAKACIFAQTGEKMRLLQVVNQALMAVEKLADWVWKAQALSTIAQILISIGENERAETIANMALVVVETLRYGRI